MNSPGASAVIVRTNGNAGGASASNSSSTTQGPGKQNPNGGKNSGGRAPGKAGCGGAGQFQTVGQLATTWQNANANANAYQNAVNSNAPVTIAGGSVLDGSSSADQIAGNLGAALSLNLAGTWQQAFARQVG